MSVTSVLGARITLESCPCGEHRRHATPLEELAQRLRCEMCSGRGSTCPKMSISLVAIVGQPSDET